MALPETLENKKSEDEEMEDPIEGQVESGNEVEESENDEQTEEHDEQGDPEKSGKVTLAESEELEEADDEGDEEEHGMITDESGKKSSKELDEEKAGEVSTGKKLARKRHTGKASSERPVREKKIVNRYSSQESAKSPNVFSVEKGRGTPLKDIPNVAFMLSKRKIDNNLKMLHSILFGRKTSAPMLKKNIGQFSGYAWLENEEEKQRAKVKDKLNKCVKEKLFDFCGVLNIQLNKSVKKEEVSAKLLEFLESPHVTTDVVLADKEQRSKKRNKRTSSGKKIKSGGKIGEASSEKQKGRSQKRRKSLKTDEEDDDKAEEPSEAEDSSHKDDINDPDSREKGQIKTESHENKDGSEVFLESPHATTEAVLVDMEQKGKKRNKRTPSGKTVKSGGKFGESPSKKQKRKPLKKKRSLKTEEEHDDKAEESSETNDNSNEDEIKESDSKQKDVNKSESRENKDESKEFLESPLATTDVDIEQKGRKRNKRSAPSKTIKSGGISGDSPYKKRKGRTLKKKGPEFEEEHDDKAEEYSETKNPSHEDDINDPKALIPKESDKMAGVVAEKPSPTKKGSKSKKPIIEKESPIDCSLSSMKKSAAKKETSSVQGKGKTLKKAKVEPTKEEIHAAVGYILKEVDFNTATLSDIIKKLGAHFDMDMMHKKIEVKAIITDLVSKMSDGEDEEEESEEIAGKKEDEEEKKDDA